MKAKTSNTIKRIVDVVMTLLLLCLMAYQVTGETLHEWFGIAMTVILIVHHILNNKWYKTLFKGKYNAYRVVTAIVNTLLLASIGLTAFCGMSMSVGIFILLIALTVSFSVFSGEYHSGTDILLWTSKNGRGTMTVGKYSAALLLTIVCSFIMEALCLLVVYFDGISSRTARFCFNGGM